MSALLGTEFIKDNKFAYFYEKNATISPEYEVYAGIKDPSRFGQIKRWNNKEKLSVWRGDTCNMINGSDGTLFPPFLTKETVLSAFEADVCRSAQLVYKAEDEVDGIRGLRFGMPSDFFTTNTSYNECFCPEEDR